MKSYGLLNSIYLGEILSIWGQNKKLFNSYKHYLNKKNDEFKLYLSITKPSVGNGEYSLIENIKNQNGNWYIPGNYVHNDLISFVKDRETYILGKNEYYRLNSDYYQILSNNLFIDWYGYYLYRYTESKNKKEINNHLKSNSILFFGGSNVKNEDLDLINKFSEYFVNNNNL